MSTLKSLFCFLLLISALFACSGNDSVISDTKNAEVLPKVDKSIFHLVKKQGFTIPILKEMTENQVSGDIVFSADYLPKEYHLKISKVPIARFRKHSGFPGDAGKQLEWFANRESNHWKERLLNLKPQPLRKVTSNKRNCFKQTLRGKEFGFPLEKTYFLRYYQSNGNFYAITSWTVSKEAKTFKKLIQYMGMKFRLLS